MSAGHIHTRFRTVSASMLIETLGRSLAQIKDEDEATDADLGVALGKSGDRAESYRKGVGDMGVVSFLRGCAAWDGRFANAVLATIGMKLVPLDIGEANDRSAASALTKLLFEMSVALEDGQIDVAELAAMAASLDVAGQCIDGMRHRLSVRAA